MDSKEVETLKADLYEAWDNSTWWRNRYNSEYKINKELKKTIKTAISLIKEYKYHDEMWGAEPNPNYDELLNTLKESCRANKRNKRRNARKTK